MNILKLNETVLDLKTLDISKQAEFSTFVEQAKLLQSALDAAWKLVDEQMKHRGIKELKGEYGTVLLVPRKSWKADKTVPPRFFKQTLDTSKLSFMFNHGDSLPQGVSYTESFGIRKNLK